MAAGIDNTSTALNALVLASVAFPEPFQKARIAIDSVCGKPPSQALRFPTLSDLASLPYVEAFVKEALRWRPPVALVPPH